MATQVKGFSANITGTPVSSATKSVNPCNKEVPPLITIPLSTISAEISGGI